MFHVYFFRVRGKLTKFYIFKCRSQLFKHATNNFSRVCCGQYYLEIPNLITTDYVHFLQENFTVIRNLAAVERFDSAIIAMKFSII